MAHRTGKYQPIARALVGTGLRRDQCAHMLGISPLTLTDWANQGRWNVPRSFRSKGMHPDVENFLRYRFRALAGNLFYLIHARTEEYIHKQFTCGDVTMSRALRFVAAQRLFAEVFERELLPFANGTAAKEMTTSHLWSFTTYVESRLIKIGTCSDCGVTAPEHLRNTAPFYFCRCHKPARAKEYWDKFNELMFDELFPKFDTEEIAGALHIEKELQKILREIALEAVCLTQKSA